MGKELRREPRVKANFEFVVETAGKTLHYYTRNASFSGVFLISENPLPLRRLVRLKTELDGEPIEMIGMVAHTINGPDAMELGKNPGMGVALFSLGPEPERRWREWVRVEYEKDPEAHAALMATELPKLRIHLKNEAMKEQFFQKDYPSGTIFYRTPDLLPEGTRVVCEVKHPDTGRLMELFATVTETVEGARRKRGIRLSFEELSEASTERFGRFERGEVSEAMVDEDSDSPDNES